jgi:hypothetical protein
VSHMLTKLIRLKDGILVEVDAQGSKQQIAGGSADQVQAASAQVKPILLSVSNSFGEVLSQQKSAGSHVDEIEVDIGLSFEGEGNVYVCKAKAGANFTVKMKIKRS